MAVINTGKFRATIRFVQGYRYLDRCGEAIVRLEKVLDKHWIPAEPRPTGGAMRNAKLGMLATFSADNLQVQQEEFISYEHFRDQTCKVYETLMNVFEIDTVLTPAAAVTLQIPYETIEQAQDAVRALAVAQFDPNLVARMGGIEASTSHVLCTEETVSLARDRVTRRRRIDVHPVRQIARPDFDSRVVQRLGLLSIRQQEALQAIIDFRRKHPASPQDLVQIEVESASEREIRVRVLDLAKLLDDTLGWANGLKEWFARRLEA
jgi:hypothetical protein